MLMNNMKPRKSNKFRSKKTLYIVLGLGIPLMTFFVNGFVSLNDTEVAVVIEHNITDLISINSDPWTHFIALKEGQLPGGSMEIIGEGSNNSPLFSLFGKDVYWHLPAPLGTHITVDITQGFELEIPLVIPEYLYDRDEAGNIIEIMRDDLGNRVVFGYYFVTADGIDFYTPETWTRLRYEPDFELNVLKAVVKGEFKITDIDTHAEIIQNSVAEKVSWMEELGFYGEMTNPPLVKDQLEDFFLNEALRIYILELKFPAVLDIFADQFPNSSSNFVIKTSLEFLIENPDALIGRLPIINGTLPHFEEFLTSNQFIEQTGVDIEELYGINIFADMEVSLIEEPF